MPMQMVRARHASEQRGGEWMHQPDRLEQLFVLIGQLEGMPASAERDWMLAEIRSRAVDLETGVAPRALRALPRDEALAGGQPPPAARPRYTRQAQIRPAAPTVRSTSPARRVEPASPPSRVIARAEHENATSLLVEGRVLCLDDPPATASGESRPWAGGLRG